jgi:cytochrome c oxidase subunit 2
MSLRTPLQAILIGLLGIVHLPAQADYVLNMTPGVTEISRGIHQLHMTIFWICVIIGAVVFSVMFYAIIWHRKSRGVKAAHFHENIWVEITWTIIPFTILMLMAVPAARLLIKMNDTERDSTLSIKITGHQWYWEYEYLGEGVKLFSRLLTSDDQIQNRDRKGPHYLREVDVPLIVPEKQKIRFLTTSDDVIHSWWVPALGIKKDAIPGFINEAWAIIDDPGTYRGQCAELCGAMHGFMPIVVEAKPEAEYQTWLQTQKAAQNKSS